MEPINDPGVLELVSLAGSRVSAEVALSLRESVLSRSNLTAEQRESLYASITAMAMHTLGQLSDKAPGGIVYAAGDIAAALADENVKALLFLAASRDSRDVETALRLRECKLAETNLTIPQRTYAYANVTDTARESIRCGFSVSEKPARGVTWEKRVTL